MYRPNVAGGSEIVLYPQAVTEVMMDCDAIRENVL